MDRLPGNAFLWHRFDITWIRLFPHMDWNFFASFRHIPIFKIEWVQAYPHENWFLDLAVYRTPQTRYWLGGAISMPRNGVCWAFPCRTVSIWPGWSACPPSTDRRRSGKFSNSNLASLLKKTFARVRKDGNGTCSQWWLLQMQKTCSPFAPGLHDRIFNTDSIQ